MLCKFMQSILSFINFNNNKIVIINRIHKNKSKQYQGAILLEALLMIGLLMLATPLIMNQVQKRNSQVENLLIANEIKSLQSAGSSMLIFEKESLIASMVDSVVILQGEMMKNKLVEYGLPSSFSVRNSLGLVHGILFLKTGSETSYSLSGFVISKFENPVDPNNLYERDLDPIKRNDILNAIGWDAAYIDEQGEITSNLPNYDIPFEVRDAVGRNVFLVSLQQQQNFGDFMAKQKLEGNETYNTMFTVLNMNNNNIKDVSYFSGSDLTIEDIKLEELTTVNMELNYLKTKEFNAFKEQEITTPATLKVSDLKIKDLEAMAVNVRQLSTKGTTTAGEVDTANLQINNNGTIDKLGFVKSIDTEVLRMQNLDTPIYANAYKVKNAVVIVNNIKETLSATSSSTAGWQNQTARIAPANKSTMVEDVIIQTSAGQVSLSDTVAKYAKQVKEILNQAITTWPTWW